MPSSISWLPTPAARGRRPCSTARRGRASCPRPRGPRWPGCPWRRCRRWWTRRRGHRPRTRAGSAARTRLSTATAAPDAPGRRRPRTGTPRAARVRCGTCRCGGAARVGHPVVVGGARLEAVGQGVVVDAPPAADDPGLRRDAPAVGGVEGRGVEATAPGVLHQTHRGASGVAARAEVDAAHGCRAGRSRGCAGARAAEQGGPTAEQQGPAGEPPVQCRLRPSRAPAPAAPGRPADDHRAGSTRCRHELAVLLLGHPDVVQRRRDLARDDVELELPTPAGARGLSYMSRPG